MSLLFVLNNVKRFSVIRCKMSYFSQKDIDTINTMEVLYTWIIVKSLEYLLFESSNLVISSYVIRVI